MVLKVNDISLLLALETTREAVVDPGPTEGGGYLSRVVDTDYHQNQNVT